MSAIVEAIVLTVLVFFLTWAFLRTVCTHPGVRAPWHAHQDPLTKNIALARA